MQCVLVYRGIDDTANLRMMRVALEMLRVRDFGPVRLGPFDDRLVAEGGIMIEASRTVCDRLKKEMDDRLARANIPAIGEMLEVLEEGTLGA